MMKTRKISAAPLFRITLTLGVLLTISMTVRSQTCEDLFKKTEILTLVHESWLPSIEREYEGLQAKLGVPANGVPAEMNIGKILYIQLKAKPSVVSPLLGVGFKVVEPLTSGDVGRVTMPVSVAEYFKTLQGGAEDTSFKVASYGEKGWYPLEQALPEGVVVDTTRDMPFPTFIDAVAKGYFPHSVSSRSLTFMHDAAHATDFKETPGLFPAWQKFAKQYVAEGWAKIPVYKSRADVFMEMSYILKPEMYEKVDSYLVSSGKFRLGILGMHAREIYRSMKKDLPETIAKITNLTSSFDELFQRHGGGARDFSSVDDTLLTKEVIKRYVTKMKSTPERGTFQNAIDKKDRIEAVESLEGIKRQIEFGIDALKTQPADEAMRKFVAYRVAQMEIAILQQRKLELTQIDVVEDSALPLYVDSKTRRYFKSFQPPGSFHRENFVGR